MTQDINATLLPASRIDFFVLDDATAKAAETLKTDWRFARVDIDIVREGMEGAVARYGDAASPELIIVETNDIGDAFIEQLGQLASVCAEGTDAVVIGPMNDIHLYRSLVGMGVRDYLVRPVSDADLVNVIAKSLVEKRGLSNSRLVSVMGSKGGVGATAIAQVLAWIMAETLGQKTMLMDAAGSAGGIGISYAIEPATNVSEGVRIATSGSEDDLQRIIQTATDNLSLLVCGGDPVLSEPPTPDNIEEMVNRILQKSPVVVMDLSAAPRLIQKRILSISSHVVMVSTPQLPALRNCRSLMTEIKAIRDSLNEFDLVINMTGVGGGEEVPAADIKKVLDLEPAARLAHQPKIFLGSETEGKPVGQNKAAADILKKLTEIAVRASGAAAAEETDEKKSNPFAFLTNKMKSK